MTSIRLSTEVEAKLAQIAQAEKTTKSRIVRDALENFIDQYFQTKGNDPFSLGEDLFGRFGSGRSNSSKDYKQIIGRNLRDKFSD